MKESSKFHKIFFTYAANLMFCKLVYLAVYTIPGKKDKLHGGERVKN